MKLTEYYEITGNPSKVVQFIRNALVIEHSPGTYLNDASCYGVSPYIKLYSALLSLGNKEEAREWWSKAVKIEPNNIVLIKHKELFEDL